MKKMKEAYYTVHGALRTLAERSGITDIEADVSIDAPVEYYNLQGIRVSDNMSPGIYIMRQGNRAKKIIIR